MGTGIKDKYNVAINSRGYMLRGAPDKSAYQRSMVPSQIDRLAISDLAYSDFSGNGLFYIAQTDWSAGMKDEKLWRDDAKFWYSTNIDTFSEQGSFTLPYDVVLNNDFDEDIYCGTVAEVDGAINLYIGTYQGGDSRPNVYKYSSGSFSEIAGSNIGTNQNSVAHMIGHKNKLWVLTIGVGATYIVNTYDGTNWADLSNTINLVLTDSSGLAAAICATELAGTLYINVENGFNDQRYIVSTVDGGTTFVEEVYLQTSGRIISMCAYNGKIYYLLSFSGYGYSELRVFDPVTSSDAFVAKLQGIGKDFGKGNNNLIESFGKLIIAISNNIYTYDGVTLTRVHELDQTKNAIGKEAYSYPYYGAVLKDNELYFANLVYDGDTFHNWKKPLDDGTNNFLYPLCIGTGNELYYVSDADVTKLYKDNTTFKPTLAKNYIVFNEMAPVVSIDKLLHSVTIIFDALTSNESIAIYYSINDRSTWTQIGTTMTSSTEGSNTKREFIVPNNVIFNKVWFKVHMAGTTTSPTVRDFIVSYKPMPDYKNRWQMRLDFSDSIKLLDGKNEERTGSDLISGLWNEKVNKRRVTFEDIDYIECSLVSGMSSAATSALVDGTNRFPRQGRIRVVSGGVAEEMTYTSADVNKLHGITRALRGTKARTYPSGSILKNDYDVYIDDIKTEANFTDENKTEGIAQVLLIEA